jgi:hypothetical protein
MGPIASRGVHRAGAAAAILAAAAIAGCGGGGSASTPTSTSTEAAHNPSPNQQASGGISQSEQRAARRRLAKELGGTAKVKRLRKGKGLPATGTRPAAIVPDGPGPFFSSDTIWPISNGWEASDHRTYTGVDAGVNPADRSVGELGIFRQDFVKVTQSQKVVDVPGAGTLRITHAPLGPSASTWAQKRGELRFVGTRGIRGTLHLSDDKVTIERQGSTSSS